MSVAIIGHPLVSTNSVSAGSPLRVFTVAIALLVSLVSLGISSALAAPADPAATDQDIIFEDDFESPIKVESCADCHTGVGEEEHQAIYDDYVDASALAMEILSVQSTAEGGGFNVTMTVNITKDGQPYVDAGLSNLDLARFYAQGYDSTTRTFPNAMNLLLRSPTAVPGNPGQYAVTATGASYAPENSNAIVYGYVAQGLLETGGRSLYDNVSNAGLMFGDAEMYESYANVEGCEKCHGAPYRKYGYRAAAVPGLPDFASCKTCHMDDRAGAHEVWQQIVDDPVAWGNGDSANIPEYTYTRRIMNDVHMSHAMGFPYPQSMANCVTCHEGKMDKVTANAFFTAETCKSCHGVKSRENLPQGYNGLTFYAKKAPSLEDIWAAAGAGNHDINQDCAGCHADGLGPTFAEMHSGYDSVIYDAAGNRYADLYKAEITGLSMDDGVVDIRFASNTDLMTAPTVAVSFYGYDTREFIVSNYSRDSNRNRLEKTIGDANPLFTEEADSAQGNWHVTLDTTAYEVTPTIQDMIDDGVIKRLEVLVRPTVEVGGATVATNAVTETLVIASNTIDDNYFKGSNAIVDVEGCNACHDALATTFHAPDRGGNIVMCRACHVPSIGSSHLEMQSREIAGYVHAIHSFQAFDLGDIDFSDPVEANIHQLHIVYAFPNLSTKNCEACHLEGKFDVPDQSKSLPAVLSDSESNDTWDRNIGYVPSYVVGPASETCGGCHRADLINAEAYDELVSFNLHTQSYGYLIEDGVWAEIVAKIMALYE